MFDNSNKFAMMKVAEQKERLQRMMAKAHSLSSKTGEELAVHWTKNITYYLYKRCREFSPTPEMFGIGGNSIAATHDFKIAYLRHGKKISPSPFTDKGKKRSQFTRVMEIMRDRGRHRLYIASGWLNVKKIVTRAGSRLQEGTLRNGQVIIEITGTIFKKVHVRITNLSAFARPFHEEHGIVQAALEDERHDLAEYIARKTHENVDEILRAN